MDNDRENNPPNRAKRLTFHLKLIDTNIGVIRQVFVRTTGQCVTKREQLGLLINGDQLGLLIKTGIFK